VGTAAGGSGLKPAVIASPGGKRFGMSPMRRRSLLGPADASVEGMMRDAAVGGSPAEEMFTGAGLEGAMPMELLQQQRTQVTSGVGSTARNKWEVAKALVPEGALELELSGRSGSNAVSARQAAAWGPSAAAATTATLGQVSAVQGRIREQAELLAAMSQQQQSQQQQLSQPSQQHQGYVNKEITAAPLSAASPATRRMSQLHQLPAAGVLPPLPLHSPVGRRRSVGASPAGAATTRKSLGVASGMPVDNVITSMRISPGRFMSAVRPDRAAGAGEKNALRPLSTAGTLLQHICTQTTTLNPCASPTAVYSWQPINSSLPAPRCKSARACGAGAAPGAAAADPGRQCRQWLSSSWRPCSCPCRRCSPRHRLQASGGLYRRSDPCCAGRRWCSSRGWLQAPVCAAAACGPAARQPPQVRLTQACSTSLPGSVRTAAVL
jgi:hypothetical protein